MSDQFRREYLCRFPEPDPDFEFTVFIWLNYFERQEFSFAEAPRYRLHEHLVSKEDWRRAKGEALRRRAK